MKSILLVSVCTKKILKAEQKDQEQKEEKEDEVRMNAVYVDTVDESFACYSRDTIGTFVYVPRNLGTWHDATFFEELDFVMKVKIKEKVIT